MINGIQYGASENTASIFLYYLMVFSRLKKEKEVL